MFTRYLVLLLLLLLVVVVVRVKVYKANCEPKRCVHQIYYIHLNIHLLFIRGRVGWVVAGWVGAAPRCGVGGGNGRVGMKGFCHMAAM